MLTNLRPECVWYRLLPAIKSLMCHSALTHYRRHLGISEFSDLGDQSEYNRPVARSKGACSDKLKKSIEAEHAARATTHELDLLYGTAIQGHLPNGPMTCRHFALLASRPSGNMRRPERETKERLRAMVKCLPVMILKCFNHCIPVTHY